MQAPFARVPIYERYGKISGRAYSDKISAQVVRLLGAVIAYWSWVRWESVRINLGYLSIIWL
jgi:hypothetical protein